jgi:hypothetical protein
VAVLNPLFKALQEPVVTESSLAGRASPRRGFRLFGHWYHRPSHAGLAGMGAGTGVLGVVAIVGDHFVEVDRMGLLVPSGLICRLQLQSTCSSTAGLRRLGLPRQRRVCPAGLGWLALSPVMRRAPFCFPKQFFLDRLAVPPSWGSPALLGRGRAKP